MSADGKRLYITERASETITVFDVDKDRLTPISTVSSYGAESRDFMLLGDEKWSICTNQFGNSISVYKVEGDRRLTMVSIVSVPAPLCIFEL